MTEPRDEEQPQQRPPRSFDPADKTQPAEGGREEVEESLERGEGARRSTDDGRD